MDLAGRELLIADLDRLLGEQDGPTVVLVTHHLEELPTGIAETVLLRDGRVVAAGPTADTLTDAQVSATFGLPVRVRSDGGRFTAFAAEAAGPSR
jgi:iron complex transport system ATP-binding protein